MVTLGPAIVLRFMNNFIIIFQVTEPLLDSMENYFRDNTSF